MAGGRPKPLRPSSPCITAPCKALWGTEELGHPAGRRDNNSVQKVIKLNYVSLKEFTCIMSVKPLGSKGNMVAKPKHQQVTI